MVNIVMTLYPRGVTLTLPPVNHVTDSTQVTSAIGNHQTLHSIAVRGTSGSRLRSVIVREHVLYKLVTGEIIGWRKVSLLNYNVYIIYYYI